MAERYGFFNAVETSGGVYDRTYNAEDFASYFSKFIGNGVFVNPTDGLKVSIQSGLKVTVKAGSAYIDGYYYELTENKTLTIPVNSSSYVQEDSIVIRLDKVNRKISIELKQNDVSVSRTSTVNELQLATIRKPIGASILVQSDVTDMRPYNEVCGFVTGVVQQISTSDLFSQFTVMFNEWFDGIKGRLSEDVATSLQTQVDSINAKTSTVLFTMDKNKFAKNSEAYPGNIYIYDTENNKVSYPKGFNNSNCYVKSIMYTSKTGKESELTWENGGEIGLMRYTDKFTGKPATVGAVLTPSGVAPCFSIGETNYPSFSKQFYVKVVLEKY